MNLQSLMSSDDLDEFRAGTVSVVQADARLSAGGPFGLSTPQPQ